jgi:hypothetical protein
MFFEMEFFIKNVFNGGSGDGGHKHFVRFGKGNYLRRFLISVVRGNKIKVRASFELANDFVNFVHENLPNLKFSGKIMTKKEYPGMKARKKGGSYVYEVNDISLEDYDGGFFYLLNAKSEDMILKIKKSLPKPGKNAEKIDDKFCTLELDTKYWDKIRDLFFWDVPDNVKKAVIEHELKITDIVMPSGEDDPAKMRELAKRKGKIIRSLDIDGNKESTEVDFEV